MSAQSLLSDKQKHQHNVNNSNNLILKGVKSSIIRQSLPEKVQYDLFKTRRVNKIISGKGNFISPLQQTALIIKSLLKTQILCFHTKYCVLFLFHDQNGHLQLSVNMDTINVILLKTIFTMMQGTLGQKLTHR